MPKSVRRVVTGHDIDGRSTFIIDGPTPHVFSRSKGSAIVHELWETTGTPADNHGRQGRHCAIPSTAAAEKRIGVPGD